MQSLSQDHVRVCWKCGKTDTLFVTFANNWTSEPWSRLRWPKGLLRRLKVQMIGGPKDGIEIDHYEPLPSRIIFPICHVNPFAIFYPPSITEPAFKELPYFLCEDGNYRTQELTHQ